MVVKYEATKNNGRLTKLQDEIRAFARLPLHEHVIVCWEVLTNVPMCDFWLRLEEGDKMQGSEGACQAVVLAEGVCDFHRLVKHTGAFSEAQSRVLFRQVMSAMAHCHRFGVYHMDLKPEQLLLGPDFRLKVSDFDLAEIGDSDQPKTNGIKGTRGFMPPEVDLVERKLWDRLKIRTQEVGRDLSKEERKDIRHEVEREAWRTGGYQVAPVDVWGCGLILLHLLTGQTLLNTSDRSTQYSSATRPPPRMSPRYQAVLDRQWDLLWSLLPPLVSSPTTPTTDATTTSDMSFGNSSAPALQSILAAMLDPGRI
jgi:serine/threonine protein kinase